MVTVSVITQSLQASSKHATCKHVACLLQLLNAVRWPCQTTALIVPKSHAHQSTYEPCSNQRILIAWLCEWVQARSTNVAQLMSERSDVANCGICRDVMSDPVVVQGGHSFCRACISSWFERELTNPITREEVTHASPTASP